MTTTLATPTAATPRVPRPALLALAGFVFVAFAAMLVTGSDLEAEASLAEISAAHDQGQTLMQWTSYLAMVLAAAIVFLGAGVRQLLGRSWGSDVAFVGQVVIALTMASWIVLDAALWFAVDLGQDTTVRALNTLSSSAFLPLMSGMLCTYVGTGLAGLATGRLPRWLCTAAIVVGAMAPFGPLGFVPAMLLPVFWVAVAVSVRER